MPRILTHLWAQIPVVYKIHTVTLLALAGLITLTVALSANVRSALHSGVTTRYQQLIESGHSVFEHFYAEEQAGRLTREQAQSQALSVLRTIRFGDKNYFFVQDEDGILKLSPEHPQLEGNNIANQKTPDGSINPSQEMINVAKEHGTGAVYFAHPKDGQAQASARVAFVSGFKPWGYVIATTAFIDDIDTQTNAALLKGAAIALTVGLLIACLAYALAKGIVKPLERAAGSIDRLAQGDLNAEIADISRGDEIGRIARGLSEFKRLSQQRLELEADSAEARRVAQSATAAHEAERDTFAQELGKVVSGLANGLAKLAEGDLTFRISDRFAAQYQKLQDDFNAAMMRMQETLKVIVRSADSIRSGTNEIGHAADDLCERTERQAASLEQTAAALNEITSTVQKASQEVEHARDAVLSARTDAERGGEVVRQAIDAMGSIEKSSKQIGQIIGVIDEIAFQTNLLALNAGVEAARAGDAGRGFAVVASEVRALAQRSAEAAKEIKTLIASSETQVEQGVSLVSETGQALEHIIVKVLDLNKIVGTIASSARDQATGLREVNAAVNQMDQVTQQNAAMVEETTAASHSLEQETEDLVRSVHHFKIGQDAAIEHRQPASRSRKAA